MTVTNGWLVVLHTCPGCSGTSSETRFKLKALLCFSQSKFETGRFQAGVELAPPHREVDLDGGGVAARARVAVGVDGATTGEEHEGEDRPDGGS